MDGAQVACWFAPSQRCVCRMVVGSGREGGGGGRWCSERKPENQHHPAFFPHLSQYPKCGIFWKGKNTPPTGLQLVFVF